MNISLNSFEFYLFHFAYFITKKEKANYCILDHSNNDNANFLYFVLLERYFESFIPIPNESNRNNVNNNFNKNASHSLWQSLSSTTSTFLNLTSNKNEDNFKNDSFLNLSRFNKTNESTTFNSSQKSFINYKILGLGKHQSNFDSNNETNVNDFLGTDLYKCDIALNIFSEVWLSQASNVHNDNHLKNFANNFNCTVEHMRVIRVFVKHLHYFANSCQKKNYELNSQLHTQYNSGGIIASSINDPLDDLKRNLWSSKYQFQRNLYRFLRLAFDQWPNDSSFRVPLETWLSYIQPWRYIFKNNSKESNEDQNVPFDSSDWKRFVTDNLYFYTIILRQVISRMSKILDLNSNSLLVYRVMKVFAQDNLRDWIKEAEMNLVNGSDFNIRHNRMNASFNLLSPSMKQHISGSPLGKTSMFSLN